MTELLVSVYPWTKTIHIVAVISWMAGILYLPRLFVNHVEHGEVGSDASTVFIGMEERLLRTIMKPAAAVTWIFGMLLISTPGVVDFGSLWIWIKLACVVALSGYHGWLKLCFRAFEGDRNIISAKRFRLMNEVPTVLMIIIVIMVVVRPF